MITIESSHGIITADENGIVIEKDLYKGEDCYLSNAVKIDLEEFDKWYELKTGKPSPKPSEFDILEIGFWNADGTYTSANSDWREEMYK